MADDRWPLAGLRTLIIDNDIEAFLTGKASILLLSVDRRSPANGHRSSAIAKTNGPLVYHSYKTPSSHPP